MSMSREMGKDVVRTGGRAHRQGQGRDTNARRAALREQAYELRCLRNRTQRQIAKELGVSVGTVHNLLREEITNRLDPLKEQYLQYELDRLDHMQQAVLLVLEHPGSVMTVDIVVRDDEGKPTLETAQHVIVDDKKILAAIDRLVRISESRRKLIGLDAPVKTQVDVVETTQQDLEIQELIREAQAKAAIREAQAKAAASAEKIRQSGGPVPEGGA